MTFEEIRLTEEQRLELKRLPYRDFLLTDFWKAVAREVRERAMNMCEMCACPLKRCRLDAHHRTYEHHGYEDLYLGDLIALCETCHETVTNKSWLQEWPYRDTYDRREYQGSQ